MHETSGYYHVLSEDQRRRQEVGLHSPGNSFAGGQAVCMVRGVLEGRQWVQMRRNGSIKLQAMESGI